MKKILIIQTAFLGDVVLATAVAENLHHCFPNADISMLVRQGNETLLKDHPFLKEIVVWNKNENKFNNLYSIIRKVRKSNYDAVINMQRFFSSGLITALSGSIIKSGFDKNPLSFTFTHNVKHVIGDGRHETERNLELIKFFCGIQIGKPRLYPSAEDDKKTFGYKSLPYITLAPASVWFTKQLPKEKWVEILANTPPNVSAYLIGAPSDKHLCQEIIDESGKSNANNLSGELSLLQSASLMRDAQMNFVNDSGPLHIASAMNAPVTAYFCSTVPAFGFGPLSDVSFIAETSLELHCRPCGLHGRSSCPEGHFKCGTTIQITAPSC